MLFSTVGQGYVFLWMAIAGLLIGALYTLACGVRRLMEAGFWLSLAIDCVFGLGAAMILVAALITGTYGVVRLYGFLGAAMGELLYFVGVAGGAATAELIEKGAPVAFSNIFGTAGGMLLNICIVISCLGTLNGLMVACTRGMYAIAVRNEGPNPKLFSQVDPVTNMVTNSSVWGLLLCCVWMVYFYGANLTSGWFGLFNFDSSELPIVTIYAMYIPMLIMWMKKEKKMGFVRRFMLPGLSIASCGFMIFAAVYAHGITPYLAAKDNGAFSCPVLFYLILFAAVMAIGALVKKPKRNIPEEENTP